MMNIFIASLGILVTFVVIDAKPWCGNYGCGPSTYGGGSSGFSGGSSSYGGGSAGFGGSNGGYWGNNGVFGPPSFGGGFGGGRFGPPPNLPPQSGGDMTYGVARQNFDINAWFGGIAGGQQGHGGRQPEYDDHGDYDVVEEDEYSDYGFQPRTCRGCHINNIGVGRNNKNSFHLHNHGTL